MTTMADLIGLFVVCAFAGTSYVASLLPLVS